MNNGRTSEVRKHQSLPVWCKQPVKPEKKPNPVHICAETTSGVRKRLATEGGPKGEDEIEVTMRHRKCDGETTRDVVQESVKKCKCPIM